MQQTIRWAEVDDLDVLRDVYRRSSLSNAGDREVLLRHPDALVLDATAVQDHRTRIAVHDGTIAGFATLGRPAGAIELEDLFVVPELMRRGIASALVHDARSLARDLGFARIEVTANHHALAFYLMAGFVRDADASTRFGPAVRMHLDTD
jgi:GNAT superfamily N-acetyltransferase